MPGPPHPMQPIIYVGDVIRFKENAICRWLIDSGKASLNEIACLPNISREDHEQFAQLIGYSISGFGELSYSRPATIKKADEIANDLYLSRQRKKTKKKGYEKP